MHSSPFLVTPINSYVAHFSGLSVKNFDMGDKRKKVLVTMEEKLRALKRLDSGVTAKAIALELGVGKSTVGDWKKNRAEIEKWCATEANNSGMKVRKTMIKGKHKEIEEALYLWYRYLKGEGLPVTGPILQEKAMQFKQQIEGEDSDFIASDGWLDRWKKRFSINKTSTIKHDFEDEHFNIESLCETELKEENDFLLEKIPNCHDIKMESTTENVTIGKVKETSHNSEVAIEISKKEEYLPMKYRENHMSHSEGLRMIERTLQYIRQQEEATPDDINCLLKWKEIALQKNESQLPKDSKTKHSDLLS